MLVALVSSVCPQQHDGLSEALEEMSEVRRSRGGLRRRLPSSYGSAVRRTSAVRASVPFLFSHLNPCFGSSEKKRAEGSGRDSSERQSKNSRLPESPLHCSLSENQISAQQDEPLKPGGKDLQ